MIHMPLPAEELERRIDETSGTWRQRAQAAAAADQAAGEHVSTNLWSEIKPVLRAHQREKCAYCERKLGTAGIEWDVEHFRPKKRVDEWTSPSVAAQTGAAGHGYFRLAFVPRNYLVACKPCNSVHKRRREHGPQRVAQRERLPREPVGSRR